MEDTLHIHRFSARHRVQDANSQRRALAAQQALLDGELEAALARLHSGDEIVLVQRLQARVRLSAQHADADNARRWSDALAASLAHALQHAGPADLQRFAGRPQALRAFVADMLNGHTTRDWAWQRLALLPATFSGSSTPAQRQAALLRLLADAPEEGVPLLRGLLHSALWPRLIGALEDGDLRGLTQSVLARLAGIGAAGFALDVDVASDSFDSFGSIGSAEILAHDAATAPDVPDWFITTPRAAGAPPRAVWALRLACMLATPQQAARGAAAVDAQLRVLTAAASTHLATDPERGLRTASPSPAIAPAVALAAGGPTPVGPPTRPSRSVADDAVANDAAGRTEHGGLLLLTPLLPASGALALLQDTALWPADAGPQALHALALRLWPLAAGDAAALAFCGLPPGAAPPPRLALTTEQDSALVEARHRVVQHLAERLPEGRSEGRALRFVVARRARITADPGWIDVHFSLRDVSTELRRAALDLDPGFLPWLGVVLRYRYE